MKTIAIKVAGSEREPLEIIIHEGVTAGDVLKAADLKDYVLCLRGSPTFLSDGEELYGQLTDGDVLYACVPVGGLY